MIGVLNEQNGGCGKSRTVVENRSRPSQRTAVNLPDNQTEQSPGNKMAVSHPCYRSPNGVQLVVVVWHTVEVTVWVIGVSTRRMGWTYAPTGTSPSRIEQSSIRVVPDNENTRSAIGLFIQFPPSHHSQTILPSRHQNLWPPA